ncbi:hypothetical protein HDU79_004046 [Rhizoclosmatium sp. JEL0117]|nr:hypothetical protein HDU99_003781 [Rhizoclosmatium hyalinum]KAJ3289463.1 hypothetical protein HDU79_004046 [Rhizoclosmatium sp. JEL0117]
MPSTTEQLALTQSGAQVTPQKPVMTGGVQVVPRPTSLTIAAYSAQVFAAAQEALTIKWPEFEIENIRTD